MFLNLFKKTAEEYEFEQRISLTLQEFGNLVKTAEKILDQKKSQEKTSTKAPPNKRPKLEHGSKDGGSNV